MGFTTGFTGGVTLTLSIAYLTVLAHERNRQTQALALRSQSRVLQGLLDPVPLPPPQSRAELAREERSTLIEAVKDRWNDEIENVVRRVQRTDWNEVREGMEAAAARLFGTGLQKSREGIEEAEKQGGPKIQEAVDKSRAAAKKSAEQTGQKAIEYSEAAKTSAQGAYSTGAGTVDSARGAVRDVISKGIEKGKEALGKAQTVVGSVTEAAGSKAQSVNGSPVEKALHERYEKPDGLNKTVEEVLEERYKPIDSRDNSVLRGV